METSSSRRRHRYKDADYATEREMIIAAFDEFRCVEAFGAEYVPLWLEASDQESVRGGLRVVGEREAYHARLLEARLRELGAEPRCAIPPDVRQRKLAFYGSRELTDAEKLEIEAADLDDPAAVLRPFTDVVARIHDDPQSRELLHWIVQDELNTIRWVKETSARLSSAGRSSAARPRDQRRSPSSVFTSASTSSAFRKPTL